MLRERRLLLAAALALVLSPAASRAAGYPDKPIWLVVLFPPGGTADIVGRLVSDGIAAQLGVPVIIDNRAGGAGGSVGTLEISSHSR